MGVALIAKSTARLASLGRMLSSLPFDMGPEPRKCTCQSQSSLQHLAAFSRRPVIAAVGRYVQWRRESLPLAGTPEPQHSSQNHLGLLPSSVVTLCGS